MSDAKACTATAKEKLRSLSRSELVAIRDDFGRDSVSYEITAARQLIEDLDQAEFDRKHQYNSRLGLAAVIVAVVAMLIGAAAWLWPRSPQADPGLQATPPVSAPTSASTLKPSGAK